MQPAGLSHEPVRVPCSLLIRRSASKPDTAHEQVQTCTVPDYFQTVGIFPYIQTPSRPRVNWKSILPWRTALGVMVREATPISACRIAPSHSPGLPSRTTSRSLPYFKAVALSAVTCSTGTIRCPCTCLLYTSDAADDLLCVDLGGRRIIKKKKKT